MSEQTIYTYEEMLKIYEEGLFSENPFVIPNDLQCELNSDDKKFLYDSRKKIFDLLPYDIKRHFKEYQKLAVRLIVNRLNEKKDKI